MSNGRQTSAGTVVPLRAVTWLSKGRPKSGTPRRPLKGLPGSARLSLHRRSEFFEERACNDQHVKTPPASAGTLQHTPGTPQTRT